MKRLLPFSLAVLAVLAPLLNTAGQEAFSQDPDTLIPSETHRYLVMEGTIGSELGVRLTVTATPGGTEKGGSRVTGWYEYQSIKRPIRLWGNLEDGRLTLEEGTPGTPDREPVVTGRFDGSWTREKSTRSAASQGTWSSPDGARTLPFDLREIYAPGTVPLDFYYVASELKTTRGRETVTRSRSVLFPQVRDTSPVIRRVNAFLRSVAASRGESAPEKSPPPEWFDPEKAPTLLAVEKETRIPPLKEDEQWVGSTLNYRDADFEILYNSGGLLCVRVNQMEYFGSVREERSDYHVILDLTRGQQVSPDDLLQEGWSESLVPLFEAKIRKELEWPADLPFSEDGQFREGCKAHYNWYLCPEGIGISYIPFDLIASAWYPHYAVLTFEELAGFLKSDSPLDRAMSR